MMRGVYRYKITVPEHAVDDNDHVNNVAYVQWMQDVAIDHSAVNGCDAEVYRSLGATWIAKMHHIEYHKPALAGEDIEIATWVTSPRRISCIRRYKFFRRADDTLLATARTKWVYLDAATGRPKAIDRYVVERFQFLAENEEPD